MAERDAKGHGGLFRIGKSVGALIGTSGSVLEIPIGGTTMLLSNTGESPVFVIPGGSGVVASVAAGMPIMPGDKELFLINEATHVAAIIESGATPSRLTITTGAGEV
jgi:hypothetical protein